MADRVFETCDHLFALEIRVESSDGYWPAMVRLSDIDGEPSMISDDARRLAALLIEAAGEVDAQMRALGCVRGPVNDA
ncbi:MAG: hypothetical protein WC565_03100 [Parcubacteria group bacterium]